MVTLMSHWPVSRGNVLLSIIGSKGDVMEIGAEATRCNSECPQLYLSSGPDGSGGIVQ